MEFSKYRLKELLQIGNGKDHAELSSGVYPVYGSGGLMRYVDCYLYDGESVLLPRKGSLSNIQYANGKFWTVDTCYYTIINKSIVLPYYLYRLLNSLDLSGLDSGASIPSMTSKTYYGIKVLLPSLDIQEKISNVLLRYDDLIETNNKRIKALERMAENLYKEWFVRFRFPGHETAEFEDGIPKGWEYCSLKRVFDVRYGKDHKNVDDGIIPIFGSGGIMRYGNKALFSSETVLIPRKGSLNNIMYYSGDFWTVDTMFYTVMLKNHFAKYAYYTMSSIDMESYNSGAALPSMTTDILYHLKILVPDDNTLKKFDEFVTDIFDQKEVLIRNNKNLIKQRDLLLPRLMSGKLEV